MMKRSGTVTAPGKTLTRPQTRLVQIVVVVVFFNLLSVMKQPHVQRVLWLDGGRRHQPSALHALVVKEETSAAPTEHHWGGGRGERGRGGQAAPPAEWRGGKTCEEIQGEVQEGEEQVSPGEMWLRGTFSLLSLWQTLSHVLFLLWWKSASKGPAVHQQGSVQRVQTLTVDHWCHPQEISLRSSNGWWGKKKIEICF